MSDWKITGYQAELTLNEEILETGEINLNEEAFRYFDLSKVDTRDIRLVLFYEGREFPSFAQGGNNPKLMLSKALVSKILGVFPEYQNFYKEEKEESELPKLLFDKLSPTEYSIKLDLPWSKGVIKKQNFLDFLGIQTNLGGLKDAYDIVFLRELFNNMDNRGNSDVFMVAGMFKEKMLERLDENNQVDVQSQKSFEGLPEAKLNEVLDFLMDQEYPLLSEQDYLRVARTGDHFNFKLDDELYTELSTDDKRFIIKNMDDKLEKYYERLNAPSLTESLESFMYDYKSFYDKDFRYSFKDIITDAIPVGIERLGLIDLSQFEVEGYPGVDDWTLTPYISVRDQKTARLRDTGLYLAYILNKDKQILYLALMIGYQTIKDELKLQGIDEKQMEEILPLILKQTAGQYQKALDFGSFEIDETKMELEEDQYRNAVIAYKRYDKRSPDRETIINDLTEGMKLYEALLEVNLEEIPDEEVVEEQVEPEEALPEETVEEQTEQVEVTTSEEPLIDQEEESVVERTIELAEEVAPKVIYLEEEPTVEEPKVEPAQSVSYPKPQHKSRISIKEPSSLVSGEAVKQIIEVVRERPQETWVSSELIEPENTEEVVTKIEDYLKSKGFYPKQNLIENLYLTLKSFPLVVLSGSSGRSVDKFARLFSESIGANRENGRFLQARLGTNTNAENLFGHINLQGDYFIKGKLTDFIFSAINNPDAPYFLYIKENSGDALAEIIAYLGTRKNYAGTIITDPILTVDQFGSDQQAREKYTGLYIPNNLFIMSSLEPEEKSLSLLEQLSVVDVETESLILDEHKEEVLPENFGSHFLQSEVTELNKEFAENEMIRDVVVLLEAMNQILERIGAEIGPIERDEICLYLLYNAQEGLLSQDEALDLAIRQKIIPRIHGRGQRVNSVLEDLFKICAGTRDESALQNYPGRGGLFPNSAQKLSEMAHLLREGKEVSVL